jgi:hypothetical protein
VVEVTSALTQRNALDPDDQFSEGGDIAEKFKLNGKRQVAYFTSLHLLD